MRFPVSPMLILFAVTFGHTLPAVSVPGAPGIGGPDVSAPVQEAVSPQLAAWLARAPSTAPVVCTVDRTLAPDSVAQFEKIAAKISALYHRVHEEVRAVSMLEIAPPTEGASTAAHPGMRDGERARQQATVTANYQALLREIEGHRRELTVYTDTLRTDAAIIGFASRMQQTLILTQFGRNAYQLGEQLKAAGEGAALILQQRLSATQAD